MTTLALTRVDPADFAARREEIAALDAAVRAAEGHDALGDDIWRDLAEPAPDSVGFLVDDRAYIHITRAGTAGVAAQWTAAIVRRPEARNRAVTTTLLDAAAAHVGAHGGGRLSCWVFGATDADDALFAGSGLRRARELFEMRVALPIPETPKWPAGVALRTFEPGQDDHTWLAVNNRAFAGHPEQGDWTETTLQGRMAEPWFDPTLFLVAQDHDGMAGFNWLKLHEPRAGQPAFGEIYVIGVEPRAQGTGLGRALAVAGLGAVHARGPAVGMLFVAADNTGALALYRALGFTEHRSDRAYEREVAAS